MKRAKIQSIDVVKLYATQNPKTWNAWLQRCYRQKNVRELTDMMRRLQVGMTIAVEKKLVTDEISHTFLRWIRSIENTLKMIFRDDNPNPLYDPRNSGYGDEYLKEKRDLQVEFDKFLKKERF